MDKGPWQVFNPPHAPYDFVVASGDFEHDVWLRVSGDFADDDEKRAYCEWLAGVLNKACEVKP
jgi:hypothetical protein